MKQLKCFSKISKLFLIISLTITLLSGCTKSTKHEELPINITIFHVNDRHGRMSAEPYLSYKANELRSKGESVMIFDAGDALHGQIETNLTSGSSMVQLMNEVGYNGMVVGNHEFTYGVDRLLELSSMMDFPLIASNVMRSGIPVFQEYNIFYYSGIKIGVFGVVTPETSNSMDPRVIAGLDFDDPQETAIRLVTQLKEEGCDFIIALAHLGDSSVSSPENRSDALAISGVDLVIDGHSHSLLPVGRTVGNTLIVQAGEFAEHIGVVKISIYNDWIDKSANIIIVSDDLPKDTHILNKINEIKQTLEGITSQVVGYTPYLLKGERDDVRTEDTNLSNLITDSMQWYTQSDISFISGGSIRASIPAGNITYGQVLTTMPYSNLIITMEINGTTIMQALEHGVSLYPEPVGLFLQFAGLLVTFNPNAPVENRITNVVMSDGSTFDINRTYKVAMLEFLAVGGDGYTMLQTGQNIVYYGGDAEAFINYLATNPVINEEGEGRITE
ncbi:MAG: bifunctional metallophosphatase/5'-nucleotidase [Candidatus Cloacimonetes bacterium]|nr:bifunctional metallophosphatase/5'-nucleotidase [Candidatus Cloacimonadota bacterium]